MSIIRIKVDDNLTNCLSYRTVIYSAYLLISAAQRQFSSLVIPIIVHFSSVSFSLAMTDRSRLIKPLTVSTSHCKSIEEYNHVYAKSVKDSIGFWTEIAVKNFYWKVPPEVKGTQTTYANFDPNKGNVVVKFWEGAKTNICYNVLDRICSEGHGARVAFYWEGNCPTQSNQITYNDLLTRVKKFANVLKGLGVSKGDRVALYMPMAIELVTAMLACARIGAIHSIVFAGFSAESLSGRIKDCEAKVVITADGFYRGEKLIKLKSITDEALQLCVTNGHKVSKCVVVHHLTESSPTREKLDITWNPDVDMSWGELMEGITDSECDVEWMDAEDPLFILYTSGSTGKPKGMLHTVGGYMVYAATTFKYSFDYHPGDIYFCTADIGWITGHSYIVYGPMANGASSVLFEGTPLYPDAGRLWAVVEKYKVNQFYTAPTAIRMLMKFDYELVRKYDRSSLKVLGTVGEPINPDSWLWYYEVVGDSKCPIVDTYWQTETGGHVITNLPFATPMKPGSASNPFFGVCPLLLDENAKEISGPGEGFLVIKSAWPGIARSVYGNHERFENTYFKRFPGYYMTGDRAKQDKDGYFWIVGRADDMINVNGHLLSTAEVESALVDHADVVEAAVVGRPHPIKGECVYCFVTMKNGCEFNDDVKKELKALVRKHIGGLAAPDYIQNAPNLPKTRSGKIMRRILRKIASKEEHEIGDVSTLADASVVDVLITLRPSD